MSFGLQHLHSTFSKGHSTGFQKQSLRILHCVGAQRASSTFTLWLLRTWHLLCKEFDALHCTQTIKWSNTKARMAYQLVQTLEPEVPEHKEQPHCSHIQCKRRLNRWTAPTDHPPGAASASQHPQVTYSKATRTLQVLTFVPI